MTPLDRVLHDVRRERGRQQMLKAQGRIQMDCADPSVPLERKMLVLDEERGEVSIEANRIVEQGRLRYGALREELIQEAAVCLAIAESLDT